MDTPRLEKTQIGINDDGTPRFNYTFNGPEGGGVIRTGPISATIALRDGTVYDLTEEYIAHHPGHAGPITHHIEMLHERSGRLQRISQDGQGNYLRGADGAYQTEPFTHICTEDCGDEAIPERMATERSDAQGNVTETQVAGNK